MSECVSKNFIKNGEVYDNSLFSDDDIKEGKSIYEVIRVIEGVPLFVENHMSRLEFSTNLTKKIMLLNQEKIKENIKRLIMLENKTEGNIKIVFNYQEQSESCYFYFLKRSYPKEEDYKQGVHTILYHGERDNPNAKVINSTFREKVEKSIKENNAYEAILVDNNGFITEGSKSNIFMICGDSVITSPVEAVLPGVTRNVIISLLKNANIDIKEERLHYNDINKLEALFISGTSPKVLPIKSVDNMSFYSPENELVRKIMSIYNREVESYIQRNRT